MAGKSILIYMRKRQAKISKCILGWSWLFWSILPNLGLSWFILVTLSRGGKQEGSFSSANYSNSSTPLHCPTSLHLEPPESAGDFSHWSPYSYFTPSGAFKCVHPALKNKARTLYLLTAPLHYKPAEPAEDFSHWTVWNLLNRKCPRYLNVFLAWINFPLYDLFNWSLI